MIRIDRSINQMNKHIYLLYRPIHILSMYLPWLFFSLPHFYRDTFPLSSTRLDSPSRAMTQSVMSSAGRYQRKWRPKLVPEDMP
jgi:hypothetical protein